MEHEPSGRSVTFAADSIDVLKVTRNRNYTNSQSHGRSRHSFIYTNTGCMRYTFLSGETDSISAAAGELVFIPQKCAHFSTYLADATEVKIIQFDLSAGALPAYLTSPQKLELHRADEAIDAFFDPLADRHPFYLLSCLYALLWQIDDAQARRPSKYQKLQRALDEMAEHYAENEKIAHYAALCGMSETGFRRLFRAYTGLSPVEYRNHLRLSRAKIKLQSGEYNVSEAAEMSGFTNLSFFIRLYKKKYGHTPKKE
ncbi:MAG: helix-turn-helix transcriptional regulator [Clostridia bacterium]|nr:helix-turn-helix transcriptional regulator [Clostridia bacterium]